MHNRRGDRPRRASPRRAAARDRRRPRQAPISAGRLPAKGRRAQKGGQAQKSGRAQKKRAGAKGGRAIFPKFYKNSRPSGSRRAGDLSKIIAGAAVRPTTGRARRRNRPPRRRRPPLPARLPACSRRGCRCRARRSRRLHRRRICGPPP